MLLARLELGLVVAMGVKAEPHPLAETLWLRCNTDMAEVVGQVDRPQLMLGVAAGLDKLGLAEMLRDRLRVLPD